MSWSPLGRTATLADESLEVVVRPDDVQQLEPQGLHLAQRFSMVVRIVLPTFELDDEVVGVQERSRTFQDLRLVPLDIELHQDVAAPLVEQAI